MSLMLTYKAIYQTALAVSMEMGTDMKKEQSMSFTERDEEVSTEPMVVDAEPISIQQGDMVMQSSQVC